MYFRETGLPEPARVVYANADNASLIVRGGQEEIVVYDITTDTALQLTDGSNVIISVQPGNCNLSSPVRFGRANNVSLVITGGTGNVTVTYDILRPPVDG